MKQKLIAIALGLVTALVVLELFSLGWYAVTQGGLFYTTQKASAGPGGKEVTPEESIQHRLHPYFGFVRTDNEQGDVNNHGFAAAPYDYPFVKRNENQVVIGMFGGSVAAGFVRQGQDRLVQRLKQNPAFQDKEIVLLSFAQGGYKQPQQLLVLSYYLMIGQELDMVINLDGFNEVALSSRNNANRLDISMPSTDHILPLVNLIDQSTLTDERIESLARIERTTARLERTDDRLAHARLASTWFISQQIHRILSARLAQEQVAFQDLDAGELDNSMMALYPPMNTYDQATLYSGIATEWANASVMMDTLLEKAKVSRTIISYNLTSIIPKSPSRKKKSAAR